MTEQDESGAELLALRWRMSLLSGIEPRLEYITANCPPEGVAAAREYVRLSRLADDEDPDIDGRRWASCTHAAIAKRIVDAILSDAFQGHKDHLRDHMLGVAAKVDRGMVMEPWWEAVMASEIARANAESLREAADAMHDPRCMGCDPASGVSRSAEWLRERANQMEKP